MVSWTEAAKYPREWDCHGVGTTRAWIWGARKIISKGKSSGDGLMGEGKASTVHESVRKKAHLANRAFE